MGILEKFSSGGLMNQIRCDEQSYLIWKWRPKGNNNNRENAIRWGSSLRVKDGEVAVFVYKQKNGTMQDFIEGPFDQIIKTANLPVLADIIGLAYDGGTPFQAEVYFINLSHIVQVKFAVPYFDVFDPRFSDFGVPVAVRGTISFRIEDYSNFIKLHRLSNFNLVDFQKQICDTVSRYVKDTVSNAPAANDIPIVQLENKIAMINDIIEYDISERLREDFGVSVSGIDINDIDIDKSSDEYSQLMSITKEVTSATIKAQTTANIKNIHDKQRIEAENYEETLRIQREESQYAQHKQTQTTHMTAFQTEMKTEVGIAGANALGQMGANGAGSIDLGNGGVGFNPAAMMSGIALGSAVGQNIAGTVNDIMSDINQSASTEAFPPPIPNIAYHVAVNGQATGPFDIDTLNQMSMSGQINSDTLVWKPGMSEWVKAGTINEIKNILVPPIPSEN